MQKNILKVLDPLNNFFGQILPKFVLADVSAYTMTPHPASPMFTAILCHIFEYYLHLLGKQGDITDYKFR